MCSQMFLNFKLLTDFIFLTKNVECDFILSPETLEKWTQFKKTNKKDKKYETSEIKKKQFL